MLPTFQNTICVQLKKVVKRLSLDILPVLFIPIIIGVAAINEYMTIIMLTSMGALIGYIYYYISFKLIRTRFLCLCVIWSVVYMLVFFEFTVPLFELLPEENCIFILLSIISILFLWRTNKNSILNHFSDEKTMLAMEEEKECDSQTTLLDVSIANSCGHTESFCTNSPQNAPSQTAYCSVCGTCIKRKDHHCYWLNCCIGESNHNYYLGGLFFAELALLLGANLSLTAVCHPFVVVRILGILIMLPDDCSDVYDIYEFGISFVIAIYALLIACYIAIALSQQFYFISKRTTMYEYKKSCLKNRHTFWTNRKSFVH